MTTPALKRLILTLISPALAFLAQHIHNYPVIAGDRKRLHIDPTASLADARLNTLGGDIVVGAYAFAGHGVIILTGSHDTRLTSAARLQSITGGSVTIGAGVWLGSGCIVLGPSEIGDDAVIAAGAVVAPGTRVRAGEMWGGVPARKIGEIGS